MRQQTRFDWFDYTNYALICLFSLLTIYPIIFVIAGSFNDGIDYLRGGVFLYPRSPSLGNYIAILSDQRLVIGYRVTVLRTVIGSTTHLLFTSMVAYGMSRRELRFRNTYWWINLFTLFFNGGLIPIFMVLKTLGFINRFSVYIIPLVYGVFNMIIIHNYFRTIPEEMHESAAMDGAAEFRIWLQLFMPLSTPVLATIALWTAVFHWNAFFDSMVFTTNPRLATLQLYLMKLIKESGAIADPEGRIPSEVRQQFTAETIRLAAIVVSIVPILLIYPFLQRYFVKGILLGSLKG